MRRTQRAGATRRFLIGALAVAAVARAYGGVLASANDAPQEYRIADRWDATASDAAGGWGDAVTVTWSIVPDGTLIPSTHPFFPERGGPSDLIASMDAFFGAGSGPAGDVSARSWFRFFRDALARWGELSGVDFIYQAADDGAALLEERPGALGVRGDIRIGGRNIDGDPRLPDGEPAGNTLGFGYFPLHGDFILDTANLPLFVEKSADDYLMLRNTLMHEFGHTLGLAHTQLDADPETPGAQPGLALMEPSLTLSFDGPQLDDVIGVQNLYGDRFEKGGGNDEPAFATPLGTLAGGAVVVLGADADSVRIEPSEIDFVSINSGTDVDLYRFTVERPFSLAMRLAPAGAPYLEVGTSGLLEPIDPLAVGDLSLMLLAADGQTPLASLDAAPVGEPEIFDEPTMFAAGDYFVRASATTAGTQLYRLELAVTIVPEPASAWGVGAAAWARARSWRRRRRAHAPRAHLD